MLLLVNVPEMILDLELFEMIPMLSWLSWLFCKVKFEFNELIPALWFLIMQLLIVTLFFPTMLIADSGTSVVVITAFAQSSETSFAVMFTVAFTMWLPGHNVELSLILSPDVRLMHAADASAENKTTMSNTVNNAVEKNSAVLDVVPDRLMSLFILLDVNYSTPNC